MESLEKLEPKRPKIRGQQGKLCSSPRSKPSAQVMWGHPFYHSPLQLPHLQNGYNNGPISWACGEDSVCEMLSSEPSACSRHSLRDDY